MNLLKLQDDKSLMDFRVWSALSPYFMQGLTQVPEEARAYVKVLTPDVKDSTSVDDFLKLLKFENASESR